MDVGRECKHAVKVLARGFDEVVKRGGKFVKWL